MPEAGGSAPVAAAQYLRKSSEHQRYSLENQAAAIALYALRRNYRIVRTYADAGRSGLTFKGRPGLQALISDVAGGGGLFDAVLVFDVSRWGRFQDPDQAGHYEFLCREAGVAVRYCAEGFENDGSLSSSLMKQLKRVMAAEYSRELGVRVLRGQRHVAGLGFSAGGPAPYGFRRQLVDGDGRPRLILGPGQVKAVATDRVRLVPGPPEELEAVRAIFRLYVGGGRGLRRIAQDMAAAGAPPPRGGWSAFKVGNILANEVYRGVRVYGRRSERLRAASRKAPEAEWVRARVAPATVSERTFRRAQQLRAARRLSLGTEELLERLRRAFAAEGRLTGAIVRRRPELPSPTTIETRFGTLAAAFEAAGYRPPRGARKWRRETLLDELRRLQVAYGATDEASLRRDPHAPLPRTFARWFGSLQAAQAAAGVPQTPVRVPLRKPRRTTDRLVAELRRLHAEHGRLSWRLIEADPSIAARTVRRRFGSLARARAAAGLS
ncbi:recombinase family protein [Phenylobacterium terrae]|uniref:Recombinase family protein n=1 Tax=Phenylobacterium terrae TaxID=2665495 RepID=A0ABW4N699_9CAUL